MSSQHADINRKKPPKSRIAWGAFVLVVGFLSPLLIPVVLGLPFSDGIKTVISGLLAFGIPELFMVIAVAIMGKDGFDYLKRYVRLVIRIYGPPDKVSKKRYVIGLVMFVVPLLFGLLAPYLLAAADFYQTNALVINISLDCMLFFSLLVLGGEFWDKLRSLFVYGSVAKFPPKELDKS